MKQMDSFLSCGADSVGGKICIRYRMHTWIFSVAGSARNTVRHKAEAQSSRGCSLDGASDSLSEMCFFGRKLHEMS